MAPNNCIVVRVNCILTYMTYTCPWSIFINYAFLQILQALSSSGSVYTCTRRQEGTRSYLTGETCIAPGTATLLHSKRPILTSVTVLSYIQGDLLDPVTHNGYCKCFPV